ncbi:helix-turn-helix domain-containing protein [Flavobacterium sp. ZE23DGlu08]|uniref:helix-turn-helix domain-containing protein n=1 Tax=Flavobacterium sp. ZE23DGlu08 TaxID=3059026 RepID=UPI00265E305A|nr:helix-turn-helix domain-containing protein [Flavobacterium sp. ZE23DGlu08]WKL43801.1 helix-turn-helix domain-containing protein [Flavobacterium sp. ZE23DGlu08]
METNSILLQNLSTDQLTDLIGNVFDTKLKAFQENQNTKTKTENDDLMTREQVLELLQINASTLWHWQNKGRITVYKFANKCYYKRSELMTSITPLNK